MNMTYLTAAVRVELDQRKAEARTLSRAGGIYFVQSFVDDATECVWCDCPGKLRDHTHAPDEHCGNPPIRSMHMFNFGDELVFGACERHWPVMVHDMAAAVRTHPYAGRLPIGMAVLDVDPGDLRSTVDPTQN
jgi:hypothetical protein